MSVAIKSLKVVIHELETTVPSKCDTEIRVEAHCLMAAVLHVQKLHDQALAAWAKALEILGSSATASSIRQQNGLQWLCIIHLNMAILQDRYLGNLSLGHRSFRCCLEASTDYSQISCKQDFRQTQAYVRSHAGTILQ